MVLVGVPLMAVGILLGFSGMAFSGIVITNYIYYRRVVDTEKGAEFPLTNDQLTQIAYANIYLLILFLLFLFAAAGLTVAGFYTRGPIGAAVKMGVAVAESLPFFARHISALTSACIAFSFLASGALVGILVTNGIYYGKMLGFLEVTPSQAFPIAADQLALAQQVNYYLLALPCVVFITSCVLLAKKIKRRPSGGTAPAPAAGQAAGPPA